MTSSSNQLCGGVAKRIDNQLRPENALEMARENGVPNEPAEASLRNALAPGVIHLPWRSNEEAVAKLLSSKQRCK